MSSVPLSPSHLLLGSAESISCRAPNPVLQLGLGTWLLGLEWEAVGLCGLWHLAAVTAQEDSEYRKAE